MGSQAIQGKLWGAHVGDWASIQEKTGDAGYQHALKMLKLSPADHVLDAGCGSGYFCILASASGATVTGMDASDGMIAEATRRAPAIKFLVGEIEELPFPDNSFSVVTGFNSFQYAADVTRALTDAKRVLKRNGKLVAMIWGNKEDCETASFLKALGSLLPPPPPGAPGPFALTENHGLENILGKIGMRIQDVTDVRSVWDYPDVTTALKGLLSSGPASRAIETAGYDNVKATATEAMQPFIQSNGHVIYRNKFRVVIAEK
jgi:SAM-dependent methyltransferase